MNTKLRFGILIRLVGSFCALAFLCTPVVQAEASTVFSQPYIGEQFNVDANNGGHFMYFFGGAPSSYGIPPTMGGYWTATENINKLRVKRLKGASCANYGSYVPVSIYSDDWREVWNFGNGTFVGEFCEFSMFNNDFIPAGKRLGVLFLGTYVNESAFDGSHFNAGVSTNGYYADPVSGGLAFQLCTENVCDGVFIYDYDMVAPASPVNGSTFSGAVTFAGKYNNSGGFNKIVFELNNLSQKTATSSVVRLLPQSSGRMLDYSERVDFFEPGLWQYRARLENSASASSTPWSPLESFIVQPVAPASSTGTHHTYQYVPKYGFGSNNGDGKDWQVWLFNGSSVYDWSNVYVGDYLLENFKIKTQQGSWCSLCLQRGVFNVNPLDGFEAEDLVVSALENNPQNNQDGFVYEYFIQWSPTGYHWEVTQDGIPYASGDRIVSVTKDTWVGWDGSFNNFKIFPSGYYQGVSPYSPNGRTGGSDMILQPYPVYRESTNQSCQENCFSNVLFLPGLEASRLYEHSAMFENQLWEPNRNDDVEKLFLNSNGSSVRDDIYTKDIIDEKNVLPVMGQGNIYKSFISQMNDLKTTGTINDWKAVPYDWRLSLNDILSSGTKTGNGISYLSATSSPYIIQELRRLAKSSKTGKVTIVAHSNGGLVTKALTEKLGVEASSLIDKIIFVAVPQVGTPQAIGAVLHGYDQGLPFDEFPVILTRETARTLAKNMPSAYNLLPSAKYFTTVFDPVVTFENNPVLAEYRARYGEAIETSNSLNNFIIDMRRSASSTPSNLEYPSVGNATLLSAAETVHATLDNWVPPQGVSLYEIAGWGEDTLSTIEYKKGMKSVCKETAPMFPFTETHCVYTLVPAITYYPKEVIDGDGTVVAPSALWMSATEVVGKWWVDLREYNGWLGVTKHADILEVPQLRTLIKNILANITDNSLDFISTTQPAYDPRDPAEARLSFFLHSPLHLSTTDNLGNITNSATSTILGASFRHYGEVQVLKVPKGTPITLNLEGYASGSFTLDMQEIDGNNNIISSSTISAVPTATSTTAKISFPNGTLETATPLTVDYDNNGTIDFTIIPKLGKETVFDVIPPEARMSFSTTTKSLLVEGIDESETTIHTTATSTTITDQTGNITSIIFKKLKQEKHELKLEFSSIVYNNTPTTSPKTTLQYEWSTDKQGNLKELEQKATVGTLKVEAHYDAKKNTTIIKKKLKEKHGDEGETKEIFEGLHIVKLVTERGIIKIDY